MAYERALTETDKIFEQYLHTASFNNVVVEEAFDVADPVQRWRLHCSKCGATLTYTDVSSALMASEYRFKSILDNKVAKFCKAHTHQVKHDTVKMYDDVVNPAANQWFDKLLVPAPAPSSAIFEPQLPTPLPIKKLGRKIR
jgi:hypothetical protein